MIQIETPFVKSFGDYHEISDFVDSINDVAPSARLKVYEIGYGYGYVGFFYVGRRPSLSAMKKIVQRDHGEVEWN